MNIKILTLVFVLLIPLGIMANTPEKDGIVKGKVYDGKAKGPVEYATIAIYNASDNSVITGTISDEKGNFKISGLSKGNFYVIVSFLGFENKRYDNIVVDGGRNMIDLGTITLGAANQSLEEVEIIAERQSVEFHIDKKVVSVGKQMTSASLSAVEVLENVPSVRVDIEGNVSLRGSTGFTVLIDGKPTVLEPSDALRQMPASTIENIEIITNPSAKYQPDGTGGIINIITKKNRTQGVQGLINAKAGSFGMFGGDFLLNWRKKNINFNIGADYNERPFPGNTYSQRETTLNGTTTTIKADGENERAFNGGGLRGGLDWDITDRDYFSIGFRLGKFDMNSESELNYLTTTIPESSEIKEFSENESSRTGEYYSLTGNYTHKFIQKGHELAAQLNFRRYDGDEYSQNTLAQNGIINNGTRTTEVGPFDRWELRLDYTKPIGEADVFEAGFQGRKGIGEDNTGRYLWSIPDNGFIEDEDSRNSTEMIRDISALYSVYKGKIYDFGYQLGMRGEYTYRQITSTGVSQTYTIDRWDFFPTIHLSYQLPQENQVMASYSRRIDRPRGWYLEPFETWTDMFNVRTGNPELDPEYIDAFELGYLKQWEKNQLSLEGYYRVTHGKVERIQKAHQYYPGVLVHTYDNVGTDYSLGIEAMYNISVAKWWEMNLMGNVYDYRIESNYGGVEDRTSFNWSSRINNSFVLKKNIKLQIDGNYDSPTVTAQGETEENYYMNAALRMDFMDRKFSAVIQARDVLGTSQRVSITEAPSFYNYLKRTPKMPMVSFTLSYRLNNFVQKRRKGSADSGGMEDDF